MEHVSGIKIRNIFLHNGNWWKFFLKTEFDTLPRTKWQHITFTIEKRIRGSVLKKIQFPNTLTDSNGSSHKPKS